MKKYRIRYKIVEAGLTTEGIRNVDKSIGEHVIVVRKEYPDATIVYMELLEEYEEVETSMSFSADAMIVLGMDMGWCDELIV